MRSISPGTVTVGVIAIVLGLVAAYVVRRSLEPEKEKVVKKVEDGVPMVVAKVNLPRHTRITAAHLEVKKVPADQLPEGAIQSVNGLLDRITKESIEAGERLEQDQLYGIGEKPGITGKLEPGYRAIPISISGSNMSAMLLSVGALVDVHLTFEDSRPEIGGVATKTILQRVKVLAKGQPSSRQTGSSGPSTNMVTLGVTEDQANKLITAQRSGTLSVTLCGDKETVATGAVANENLLTKTELFGLKQSAAPYTIQTWRGGQMTTVAFDGNLVSEAKAATLADDLRRQGKAVPVIANPDFQPGTATSIQSDK